MNTEAIMDAPTTGLHFERVFNKKGQDPFNSVRWTTRTAVIRDDKGQEIFRQNNAEVPADYSDISTNVVVSKYFYGDPNKRLADGRPEREFSVRQLVYRVVRTITDWGIEDGTFLDPMSASAFYEDLTVLLLQQYVAFNSPVWFNVGLHHQYGVEGTSRAWHWDKEQDCVVKVEPREAYKYPQGSACFIQSVSDDMESIMSLATSEAMLFKYGSGTGTDLSTLRSSREKVSGGGMASGPVSFMVIYDGVASTIKSGGKCLAPHQPVFTAGGVKTAKELADAGKDFTVLSYSKRLGRVAAKRARAWKSGVKEVWALRTDKGEFHLSADHPIMLATGEFVELEDLKAGMSLMASRTYAHPMGYVDVSLTPFGGARRRELLHRLVATDIHGWDINDKVVHHGEHGKSDSEPGNLVLLSGQAEHAALHSNEQVAAGTHVFQNRIFDHAGETNGMHASSDFWKDEAKVAAYKATQGAILKESGRAVDMQAAARKVKMLNTGYQLINAGHDIATFEEYVLARKAVGRRCPSVPGQLKKFEREFGSYAAFYDELRRGNHEVVEIRSIGVMDVYDIEVDDTDPDTGEHWDEHNFAIRPLGQMERGGTCIYVHNTRRAAKMQSLKCYHPDILEFIEAKAKEERKAHALIAAGYDPDFNGEAYASVRYQNCNMSIRVNDDFLRAVEDGSHWQTVPVMLDTPVDEMPRYDAGELMDKIAEGTWACGDPGLQYEAAIQRWHTCPNTGPINASNPCSEYMFLDDSSCNLASLNLMKFRQEDGGFDVDRYRAACKIMITAQEILVDHASYPTAKIAENSHRFRPLGLGYCNLGALIMAMGRPYDSPEGRATCAALTAILTGQGYLTSAELARDAGPFAGFAKNREPMLAVMGKHRNAVEAIDLDTVDHSLWHAARDVWDETITAGYAHGYRNSQISVIAPTGTIAFMMGADTTGIEPEIGLVKYKNLAGGGQLRIVNGTVATALAVLGYSASHAAAITTHMEATGTIEGAPYLKPGHLPVFDCAFVPAGGMRSIPFEGHVKMMGAAQPFVSGAISKTCNLPASATVAHVKDAYMLGWKLGLKALAIFRDGSKGSQPVVMKAEPTATTVPVVRAAPYRRRLPDTRMSVTHKFEIDGTYEGYLNVGLHDDGTPGELFITMAKEGSTVGGLMDIIGTLVSMSLQYGVPMAVLVDKFTHARFDPSGFTKNPDIPIAKSVIDYIFRWLGIRFIPGYRERNVPSRHADDHFDILPAIAADHTGNGVAVAAQPRLATVQLTGPPCGVCGAVMIPSGARCYRCDNCGNPGPCG